MAKRVIKSSSARAKTLPALEYRSLESADGMEAEAPTPPAVRFFFSPSPAGEGPLEGAPGSAPPAPPEPEPPPSTPAPEPPLRLESEPAPADGPPPAETPVDPHEIQKRAFEEGFAHGEKAGRELGERQIEAVLKRLAESLQALGHLRNKLYQEVEREVLQLALAIAKKLVRREVAVDPDIALTLVRVAMSHIAEKTPLIVRLNPVDYDVLITRNAELKLDDGNSGVALQADHSIDRGGCVIETEYGDVDARIEEQFKEVERGLLDYVPV